MGGNRPDFSWATQGFVAVKTAANYAKGGDFLPGVTSNIDTTNPDADFAGGNPAWALVFSEQVTHGEYVMSPVLIDSDGNHQHISRKPTKLIVEQDVFTGGESNIPAGIVSPIIVTGTIPQGSDEVAIPVTGMTATGAALPGSNQIALNGAGAICSTGAVTVKLSGPVDADTAVYAYVLRKYTP
jgi:hypothetical protein